MYIVQVEGASNCFAVSVFIQVDLISFHGRFENHIVRGCWTKQHFECPIMTDNFFSRGICQISYTSKIPIA